MVKVSYRDSLVLRRWRNKYFLLREGAVKLYDKRYRYREVRFIGGYYYNYLLYWVWDEG